MQNSNEKKYVGYVKTIRTQYGELQSISLKYDELEVRVDRNGNKWVNLTMGAKKEVDQYGNSHNIWIDNYEPKDKRNTQNNTDISIDDIPL